MLVLKPCPLMSMRVPPARLPLLGVMETIDGWLFPRGNAARTQMAASTRVATNVVPDPRMHDDEETADMVFPSI